MLTYKGEVTLSAKARSKGDSGLPVGTFLLRMSLRREKRIPFTPAVAANGKTRGDREAGNNETWMVILGMQRDR